MAQNSHSLVHNASRNFRDVDFESFWNDPNLDELSKPVEDCENANLEEFLNTCNEMITHSLDKHAPLRKFKKNSGHHQDNSVLYKIPFTKAKTFADGSFGVAGPRIWNGLPIDVRQSGTVDSFKTKLKTFLFQKCYSDLV